MAQRQPGHYLVNRYTRKVIAGPDSPVVLNATLRRKAAKLSRGVKCPLAVVKWDGGKAVAASNVAVSAAANIETEIGALAYAADKVVGTIERIAADAAKDGSIWTDRDVLIKNSKSAIWSVGSLHNALSSVVRDVPKALAKGSGGLPTAQQLVSKAQASLDAVKSSPAVKVFLSRDNADWFGRVQECLDGIKTSFKSDPRWKPWPIFGLQASTPEKAEELATEMRDKYGSDVQVGWPGKQRVVKVVYNPEVVKTQELLSVAQTVDEDVRAMKAPTPDTTSMSHSVSASTSKWYVVSNEDSAKFADMCAEDGAGTSLWKKGSTNSVVRVLAEPDQLGSVQRAIRQFKAREFTGSQSLSLKHSVSAGFAYDEKLARRELVDKQMMNSTTDRRGVKVQKKKTLDGDVMYSVAGAPFANEDQAIKQLVAEWAKIHNDAPKMSNVSAALTQEAKKRGVSIRKVSAKAKREYPYAHFAIFVNGQRQPQAYSRKEEAETAANKMFPDSNVSASIPRPSMLVAEWAKIHNEVSASGAWPTIPGMSVKPIDENSADVFENGKRVGTLQRRIKGGFDVEGVSSRTLADWARKNGKSQGGTADGGYRVSASIPRPSMGDRLLLKNGKKVVVVLNTAWPMKLQVVDISQPLSGARRPFDVSPDEVSKIVDTGAIRTPLDDGSSGEAESTPRMRGKMLKPGAKDKRFKASNVSAASDIAKLTAAVKLTLTGGAEVARKIAEQLDSLFGPWLDVDMRNAATYIVVKYDPAEVSRDLIMQVASRVAGRKAVEVKKASNVSAAASFRVINGQHEDIVKGAIANMGLDHLIRPGATARDMYDSAWGALAESVGENKAEKMLQEEIRDAAKRRGVKLSHVVSADSSLRYVFPSAKHAAKFVEQIQALSPDLKTGSQGTAGVVLNPGLYAADIADTARKLGGKPPAALSISAAGEIMKWSKLEAAISTGDEVTLGSRNTSRAPAGTYRVERAPRDGASFITVIVNGKDVMLHPKDISQAKIRNVAYSIDDGREVEAALNSTNTQIRNLFLRKGAGAFWSVRYEDMSKDDIIKDLEQQNKPHLDRVIQALKTYEMSAVAAGPDTLSFKDEESFRRQASKMQLRIREQWWPNGILITAKDKEGNLVGTFDTSRAIGKINPDAWDRQRNGLSNVRASGKGVIQRTAKGYTYQVKGEPRSITIKSPEEMSSILKALGVSMSPAQLVALPQGRDWPFSNASASTPDKLTFKISGLTLTTWGGSGSYLVHMVVPGKLDTAVESTGEARKAWKKAGLPSDEDTLDDVAGAYYETQKKFDKTKYLSNRPVSAASKTREQIKQEGYALMKKVNKAEPRGRAQVGYVLTEKERQKQAKLQAEVQKFEEENDCILDFGGGSVVFNMSNVAASSPVEIVMKQSDLAVMKRKYPALKIISTRTRGNDLYPLEVAVKVQGDDADDAEEEFSSQLAEERSVGKRSLSNVSAAIPAQYERAIKQLLSKHVPNGEIEATINDVKSGIDKPLAAAQALLRNTPLSGDRDVLTKVADALERLSGNNALSAVSATNPLLLDAVSRKAR